MRKLTNILRNAVAVVCCFCGMSVFAQTQIQSVISSCGAATDDFCCTVGETLVGETAGMWNGATEITTSIYSIYEDGDVVIENIGDGSALNVQLPDELIAAGAFYSIYNLSGTLLDRNQINESPYALKYDNLLQGQCIIVTIQAGSKVVATLKLIK